MLRGLLLAVLLSTRLTHGDGTDEDYFPCEPRDVKVATMGQRTLSLTWADDPSCIRFPEFKSVLVVFVGDLEAHSDEVVITPKQNGSTHHWNWTSYLPLECVSHSVQLAYQYQNLTSRQKQAQTDPGLTSPHRFEVLPQDQIFLVGSRANFCCVTPEAETFFGMYVSGNNNEMSMNTTQINSRTFMLSIDLNKPSIESGDNVICNSSSKIYGACAYVGYPPQIERLVCETRDLASVVCHWTKQRSTQLEAHDPTMYWLQGKKCSAKSENKCSEKVNENVGRKIWTLKAKNRLGSVVLTDDADLRERVHMSPVEVRASDVNARNVRVMWAWKYHIYNKLNVTCQLRDNKHHTTTISGVGRNYIMLNNLTPNTNYTVQVRCGTAQHFWKWSEWSSVVKFTTKGDVPDALNVWMQQKDNKSIIFWKDNQSNGEVLDYEVTWMLINSSYTSQPFSTREHSAVLELDPKAEFLFSVTARNKNGSSVPSTVRTPVGTPVEVTSRLPAGNGGFNLSWTASPLSSCGYIIDWFPPSSENPTVDWLKVPPYVTTAEINSSMDQNIDKLIEGVRYLISIYACTPGAPKWLETREGYVKEKKIKDKLFNLTWKQVDDEVTVSWDPIDLGTQSAFIRGYTLYCTNNKNIIRNISTDDPAATRLTVRQLPSASYTFTVKALTAVGECGASSISVALTSPIDGLMLSVIIIIIISMLLIFVSILCCRNWESIMEKVCPPIPKPALKGGFTWLVDGSPHAAFNDHNRQSEEQLFKVSLLHLKQEPGIVSMQTQHLKGLPHSTLPPANNVYLSVIPSTMVDLQNFSYNHIVEAEDQQVIAAARGQDKSICGFNLQQALYKAKADPNHLVCCDSAYISAPM
ncbi:leukemia inhibitory factor receptor-like [Synchiropus splendidus]|uniref:leukemia inhibitory factor receptor-like n=1 Tax=Synchiropus splendidus TaxID=270530 RepID=UPI00237ECF9B|nr:leukemia inhibitory factor receptor-like [Synchiropus splendidus]